MPLNINTNAAASSASYHLSKNNAALQKSLTRLSSGSRITQPADDAGGLAVSMKLSGTINRLSGVREEYRQCDFILTGPRRRSRIFWEDFGQNGRVKSSQPRCLKE